MRIIALSKLRAYWQMHADAEGPLRAWYDDARRSAWKSPDEIKATYGNASILKNSRVVFNVKGNDCRLIVKVHYNTEVVYIRFVGTRREYDQVDAESV